MYLCPCLSGAKVQLLKFCACFWVQYCRRFEFLICSDRAVTFTTGQILSPRCTFPNESTSLLFSAALPVSAAVFLADFTAISFKFRRPVGPSYGVIGGGSMPVVITPLTNLLSTRFPLRSGAKRRNSYTFSCLIHSPIAAKFDASLTSSSSISNDCIAASTSASES